MEAFDQLPRWNDKKQKVFEKLCGLWLIDGQIKLCECNIMNFLSFLENQMLLKSVLLSVSTWFFCVIMFKYNVLSIFHIVGSQLLVVIMLFRFIPQKPWIYSVLFRFIPFYSAFSTLRISAFRISNTSHPSITMSQQSKTAKKKSTRRSRTKKTTKIAPNHEI